MKVRIDKQAKHTRETHGVIFEMQPYLGTIQIIESVYDNRTVSIHGWTWNVKDLTPCIREGKPITETITPVLFHETEIVGV